MGISAYGNDMLMPVPDGPYRVDRAEDFMPSINHDRAIPGDFTPMPGPVIDFMPGSGISIPGQGFQMQPQQYMQVPYAQQYAQQGNINDPSVYAALEALNAPAYIAQPTQRYGSGITNQTGGGKGGGAPMIKDWRTRLPPPVAAPAVMPGSGNGGSYDGGGYNPRGGTYDNSFYSGRPLGDQRAPVERMGTSALVNPTPVQSLMATIDATPGGAQSVNTGMATNAAGQLVSNDMTIAAQNADMGGVSTSIGVGDIGQAAETGMTSVNGQSVSNDATIAAQDAATFGTDSGVGGDSSKIVCTAMNNAYGFGSFRNAIWLKYASKHLTKAHEAGYHALFLPLVDYGFKQGDATPNRLVRKCLEHVARHRSADLRAEMRGMKRDALGRAYRFVLEPLCLVVGKLKGY